MNPSPPTDNPFRQALPKQWPPILLYVATLLALIFTSNIDRPRFYPGNALVKGYGIWQGYGDGFGAFYWDGFAVLVALIAMLRMKIRYRLSCLLALELIRLFVKLRVTAADDVVYSTIPELYNAVGNQLAIDLVHFGFVSTIAHGVTSLLSLHATSSPPDQTALQSRDHAGIAEWLYFISIVGLIFLPLPAKVLTPSHMSWDPFNWSRAQQLLYGPQNLVVLILLGLLCLTRFRRGWRFAFFLLVAIIALEGSHLLAFFYRNRRGFEMRWAFEILTAALQSIPFWLLLRWAGYLLHSNRHPIESKEPELNPSSLNPNAGAALTLPGADHPFQ